VDQFLGGRSAEPEYFSDNINRFINYQQMARKWLAEVVQEYPKYFEENGVTFVMIEE